ncbi:MAG: DUF86 domain-containing protein [Desulfobacterota bacterium]|nr:DUF86 domain-containing protein [Thermodesulfobacteriota bacterium]
MSPGEIDPKVISQRALWILQMAEAIQDLHPEDKTLFLADRHKVAAAESYLRRALEALFDMGRHILAKKFAYPATEYKEIAKGLSEKKVLGLEEATLMRDMAGYRNRMVHFYREITPEELHEICLYHLGEIKLLSDKIVQWVKDHQDRLGNP